MTFQNIFFNLGFMLAITKGSLKNVWSYNTKKVLYIVFYTLANKDDICMKLWTWHHGILSTVLGAGEMQIRRIHRTFLSSSKSNKNAIFLSSVDASLVLTSIFLGQSALVGHKFCFCHLYKIHPKHLLNKFSSTKNNYLSLAANYLPHHPFV